MLQLDLELIFKCRLIVGRYGEMDLARWWNTSGILSHLGSRVASRGLPKSEFYGRARALFAVATHRTRSFFSPPHSHTLWSLPPHLENALDEAMIGWAHEGRTWSETEKLLYDLKVGDLEAALISAGVISSSILPTLARLQTGSEGRSIRLPEVTEITDDSVALLAAAFSRSSPDSLLLPVVAMKKGSAR
jgi:hypothetical protein